MSAKKVCAKRLRQMKKSRAKWNFFAHLALGSGSPDKPGHPPSLISIFAVLMKKAWTHSYTLSVQRRLWSHLGYAQADLSLRWAHSHIVGFVTRRLKFEIWTNQRTISHAFWKYMLGDWNWSLSTPHKHGKCGPGLFNLCHVSRHLLRFCAPETRCLVCTEKYKNL